MRYLRFFILILLILSGFHFKAQPEEIIYHTVKKGETLDRIAEIYGVTKEDLKRWNHLKDEKIVPGKRLIIKRSESKSALYHTVKKGESLEKIAKLYGVSPEDLKKWNNLKDDKIYVGQRLLVKKPEETKREKPKTQIQEKRSEEEAQITYHIVKKGETLKGIAKLYGVSVDELKEWNNLKSEKLKPGQRLLIKRSEKVSKDTKKRPKEIIYRVKPGESLSDIARLFGVSEEEIIKVNKLSGKEVRPGQKLLIRIPEKPEKEKTQEEKKEESSTSQKTEPENLKEAYQQLLREEESLRKRGLTRKDYLRLIAKYRDLYLLYPSSEIAPLSLLKTADLYFELYQKSLNKGDLLEAAKRYELFLKHFPEAPQRDKAYLNLLEIYERELKDYKKAEEIKRIWGKDLEKAKKVRPEERLKEIAKGKREETKKEESQKRPPELWSSLKKVNRIEPITGEDYTRIIIDLSGDFEYSLNILPAREGKPARLYVDLYPAKLEKELPRFLDIKDRHLEAVRTGQFDSQTVRVVLDLKSLTDYKVFKLKEPYQLIIDLVGKEKKVLAKGDSKKESSKSSKKESIGRTTQKDAVAKKGEEKREGKGESYINLARQFGLGVRRVMLDPGHGGEDPGALGPNGLKEKDVVLKIAKLLGKKLEERLGIEVLYTRKEDVYIPLAKRPALANSQKADLFISLHLNASPDPKAKGIETYYLNFTTDPEAMRVAALENRANTQGLADLQDLVKAVLANTKLNESRELATKIQKELVRTLSKFYPDVEDRGVKYAPFLVLVGTRMPAVLVEADFITNPVIAQRYLEEEFLDRIAEGIYKGIEAYIQSLKLSFSSLLNPSKANP